MPKIIGYLIETDEIEPGELYTNNDSLVGPSNYIYTLVFSPALHSKKVLTGWQKNYVKAVFTKSFLEGAKKKK